MRQDRIIFQIKSYDTKAVQGNTHKTPNKTKKVLQIITDGKATEENEEKIDVHKTK